MTWLHFIASMIISAQSPVLGHRWNPPTLSECSQWNETLYGDLDADRLSKYFENVKFYFSDYDAITTEYADKAIVIDNAVILSADNSILSLYQSNVGSGRPLCARIVDGNTMYSLVIK
eukprot:98348_1